MELLYRRMYLEVCKALGTELSTILGDEFSVEYPNENNYQFNNYVPTTIEIVVICPGRGLIRSLTVNAVEVAEYHSINQIKSYALGLATEYKKAVHLI